MTYKIEYPIIKSSTYPYGAQCFNEFNLHKALHLKQEAETTLFHEAQQVYDYNVANGYPVMVYEVILGYNITYNHDNIISLYYDEYTFTGGAHGSTIRTSQNWNMRLGKQFPLQTLFPHDPYFLISILKNINSQIEQQIESGSNFYFDNYCQLILETFNPNQFYLTTEYDKNYHIVIYFQQYDIAPYSSGIPTFIL